MADTISLEDINSAIESTDYSSPESITNLKLMLDLAEASFAVSNQYDQFVSLRKKYDQKLKKPKASEGENRASSKLDDRQFDAIKGNQERREYLEAKINNATDRFDEQEFRGWLAENYENDGYSYTIDGEDQALQDKLRNEYLDTRLTLSLNEVDFLAEQIATGNMYDQLQDGQKILRIAKALDVQAIADRAYDRALDSIAQREEAYLPAENAYVASSGASFGKQLLKDLDKADTKDTMFDLERQTDVLSANIEAYGYTSGNLSAQQDLKEKIKQLQESSKGILNFNTRRKLDAQIKKIDPAYYDTKVVYANAFTYPYYKARVALRNRSENKTKNLEKRFERVSELKTVVNNNPFWSRNMGKNIAARSKLLGNCLAARRLTAQGVAKKYAKRLDITKSGQHLESIEAKITELKSNTPSNKRGRDKIAAQLKMYEQQKALFSGQSSKNASKRTTKIDAIKTQVSPAQKEIKNRLEKVAQKLETARVEDIKSSDRYKALMVLQSRGTLNAAQKKEFDAIINGLNEKKITADRVYEEILKNEGYSGEALETKKKELFPTPEIQKTEENVEEKTPDKAEQATKLQAVVKSETRESGEEVITYASGLEVSRPNENTYNLSDKDGRNPTDEQCAGFASQLKQDGFESFAMAENVSKEFYDSMVKAATAEGLTIENKEAMDKKFAHEAEAPKRENEENLGGEEKKAEKAEKTVERSQGEEPRGKTPVDELGLNNKQKAFLINNGLIDQGKTLEEVNNMQWKDLPKATQMLLDKEGIGWQGTDRSAIKSGLAYEAHKLDIGLGSDLPKDASPQQRKKAEEKDVEKMASTLQKMSEIKPTMTDEEFKNAIKEFSPSEQKLATSINTLQKAQAKKGENLSEDEKNALGNKTTRSIGLMLSKYQRSVEGKNSEKSRRTIARDLSKQAIKTMGSGGRA